MADSLTVFHLYERIHYWRKRAEEEASPRSQTQFLETAAILAHEADLLRGQINQRQGSAKESFFFLAEPCGNHTRVEPDLWCPV